MVFKQMTLASIEMDGVAHGGRRTEKMRALQTKIIFSWVYFLLLLSRRRLVAVEPHTHTHTFGHVSSFKFSAQKGRQRRREKIASHWQRTVRP